MKGARELPRDVASERLGKHLFSYAVIADTHVNQGERETLAPFVANTLHNPRMRHVVRDLNLRDDIAFVLHLGDIINPFPSIPNLYQRAFDCYRALVSELKHPLHVLPGNHDMGDKANDWAPAPLVCEEHVETYRNYFGDDHYAFEVAGCHFLCLNAQVIGSGLPSEARQKAWLETWLAGHRGARIVLNLHYPPFVNHEDEGESYDNVSQPGRAWLLSLIDDHQVEAVFTGHVHNFWYHRRQATDYYLLPAVSQVRQDYSELARSPPTLAMEGGRGDANKLGYFLVHIHERGHYCTIVRTYGALADPDSAPPVARGAPDGLHPLENWRAPLGFDMRQDWMEVVQVAPTGGPEEFDRKKARNDYPVMAFWDMGVRRLRIPRQDVIDPDRRARLRALRHHGHEYALFIHGFPDDGLTEILAGDPGLVDALEVIVPWQDPAALASVVAVLRRAISVPLYLSRLRGNVAHDGSGKAYHHAVFHGFAAGEGDQIRAVAALDGVDGAVFFVAPDEPVLESLSAIGELCESSGIAGAVQLRMGGDSPAAVRQDDVWFAHRVSEALFAAAALPGLSVYADVFADIDRGYFMRNGVVDRLYNPRLSYHVVRTLYAALNVDRRPLALAGAEDANEGRLVHARREAETLVLVLPKGRGGALHIPLDPKLVNRGPVSLQAQNLRTDVQLRRNAVDVTTGTLRLEAGENGGDPHLLVLN